MLNGGARFTAPFGGTARRLPPNPIAIAVPTANGAPLVLDITTSMVAGGKIDVYYERGQPVPADWLIDAEGNPVTDPATFRRGESTMLPLGGALGHKGYGSGHDDRRHCRRAVVGWVQHGVSYVWRQWIPGACHAY